jgi:hypothetical protein
MQNEAVDAAERAAARRDLMRARGQSPSPAYEYKLFTLGVSQEADEVLTRLGAEGWRVTHLVQGPANDGPRHFVNPSKVVVLLEREIV